MTADAFSPTARSLRRLAAALAILLLAGCATTLQQARGGPGQRLDPWENWNRKVFAFNEAVDRTVLRPVATVYAKIVPRLVRRGVDNFFANFADAWSVVNDILQGKGQAAFENAVRVSTNTVFGLFGILDIASEFGLEHQYEDFGQTLGTWGFGAGAYIVLPILGPTTVRDGLALPLDRLASPALLINDGQWQGGIIGLQIINTRANLLGATQVFDDIALDKYTFLRDAYLQRRRSLVFDGNAPDLPDPGPSQGDAAPPPVDPTGSAAAAGAGAGAAASAPSGTPR